VLFHRILVSLPIDLTSNGDEDLLKLEEKGVKGRYVSVERIIELENGNTEWRMATSSTPGGSLPNFLVESTLAKKIASVRQGFYLSVNNHFSLITPCLNLGCPKFFEMVSKHPLI
jgi:hypothetical protein